MRSFISGRHTIHLGHNLGVRALLHVRQESITFRDILTYTATGAFTILQMPIHEDNSLSQFISLSPSPPSMASHAAVSHKP